MNKNFEKQITKEKLKIKKTFQNRKIFLKFPKNKNEQKKNLKKKKKSKTKKN